MAAVLTTALILGIVAGFILERRLLVRDFKAERKEWSLERCGLLNRIKPETAQPLPFTEEPDRDVQPPTTDEEWWKLQGVEN